MEPGPVPTLSKALRKGQITFVQGSVPRGGIGGLGEGGCFDSTLRYDKGSGRYLVTVPHDGGISDDVLSSRLARLKKAARKVEKRRKAEKEARRTANEEREEERERERRERVAQKREKKRREKEEREREEGEGGGEGRREKAVRRSSAGRKQFGGGGGGGEEGGGGREGGGGGEQLTELQKAMQKRRTKNEVQAQGGG